MTANEELFSPDEAYSRLAEYEKLRFVELSRMFAPYVEVTDDYGDLLCRVTVMLGRTPPANLQDKVVRDLIADTFDFLYESRSLVLKNKCTLAYPLARRAYESLSLMVLCCLDKEYSQKWHSGAEISHGEVRRELAKHPLGEAEPKTKELYKFFSSAAHPNREFIPERFLGEGNEFALGSVMLPPLTLITDYCLKLLSLWFWFAGITFHQYRETIMLHDNNLGSRYMLVADRAEQIANSLLENLKRLIEEDRRTE